MVDVDSMRPIRWQRPLLHVVELRQLYNEDTRGFANRNEQPSPGPIRHAPSRPPWELDRPPTASVQIHHLQFRSVVLVTDAGNRCQASVRDERDPVRPRAGVVDGTRL